MLGYVRMIISVVVLIVLSYMDITVGLKLLTQVMAVLLLVTAILDNNIFHNLNRRK